ncbi:hypothetical protein EDD16DRAFT_1533567 [Pisolithus croceorrhizus]|nr:hypothetical protein EDD16DRAFT_1533567 [Pisolithus croceorrhizus]
MLQSERRVHCSLLVISPTYHCKIVVLDMLLFRVFDCTIRYISVPNKSGIRFLSGRTMFTLPWSSYVFVQSIEYVIRAKICCCYTHGETKINEADEGRVIKVSQRTHHQRQVNHYSEQAQRPSERIDGVRDVVSIVQILSDDDRRIGVEDNRYTRRDKGLLVRRRVVFIRSVQSGHH